MSKLEEIKKAIRDKKVRVDLSDVGTWASVTPEERIRILRKCGEHCFMRSLGTLEEKLADPKANLKFPICRPTNRSRSCAISASGLLAASRRARLTRKYPDVVKQVQTLIKELGATKKARKEEVAIHTIKIKSSIIDPNKFDVILVYVNKAEDKLSRPLTAKTIIKKYSEFLTPRHYKILHV